MVKLKEYKRKRKFGNTPEPRSSSHRPSALPRFCIQKHAARRLHYDFRIEYRGVLLSWAVPKNLSLNPKDKRLAVQVEDHPLDYQYFEGTIPKGNYGAGTVEIWDKGTYALPKVDEKKEIEKQLSEGLVKGHFSLILQGNKLEGEFVFQKLKNAENENSWLVIKKHDAYSEISESKLELRPSKEIMPEFISPMLATLVDRPFDHPDWLFEVKWDGFRALAFVSKGKAILKSRTKHLLNEQFPLIVEELKTVKEQVVLDGEIVVLDAEGKSRFQLMQNYQREKKGNLFYYVFDLLFYEEKDVRDLPLVERKELLKDFIAKHSFSFIRYSDHIFSDGVSLFQKASKNQLEGIIGKNSASKYVSKRSPNWVKIKTGSRQEFVIGGFTAPRGSRKKFGALLLGVYNDKKELIYSGNVGGGFTQELLQIVYKKLVPLIRKTSPFKIQPKTGMPVTWLKPKLVCEVSFSEWTQDNILRQPIFQGLRSDKPAVSVKKEETLAITTADKNNSKLNTLSISNPEKVFWPKEGITKKDLVNYYKTVSLFILPYLKHRPITLHRYPNGIEGEDFYQKNMDSNQMGGRKTYDVKHEGKTIHYMQINDEESLLFAINLGSIDLHPFLSRYDTLEYPDFCVIDLDPHEVPFEKVVQTALVAHELLECINVAHYCKTSGGKGLHIFIPFQAKYDYLQSKQFAEILCLLIHKKIPKWTSVERSPGKRPKKIYLDYLQNRRGQTVVPPYSVRPRPFATVSTPLLWEEVNSQLDPTKFTIKTIPSRVKKMGDLFKGILAKGINLEKALSQLKNMI